MLNSEFKQIVGRGTRLFDGKNFFTIYDFINEVKDLKILKVFPIP